jgi:hypothetical protein
MSFIIHDQIWTSNDRLKLISMVYKIKYRKLIIKLKCSKMVKGTYDKKLRKRIDFLTEDDRASFDVNSVESCFHNGGPRWQLCDDTEASQTKTAQVAYSPLQLLLWYCCRCSKRSSATHTNWSNYIISQKPILDWVFFNGQSDPSRSSLFLC